jgi:hypothetical protein
MTAHQQSDKKKIMIDVMFGNQYKERRKLTCQRLIPTASQNSDRKRLHGWVFGMLIN